MKKSEDTKGKKIEQLQRRPVVNCHNLNDALNYLNSWVADIEDKVNEIIDKLNEK